MVDKSLPTTTKRSLILKYISRDLYLELYKITMIADANNNEKGALIKDALNRFDVPFDSLGSGTNRMAVIIEGYAFKIALDKDGMIDNRREMLYSKILQPYVVKVYECMPNGLVAVSEYVSVFDASDKIDNESEMRSILKDISSNFLIGDVGITSKNYTNWGKRNDGSICILDFAYIYSVTYRLFTCDCDNETLLQSDSNFVYFICPKCGRKYEFGQIRRKITRVQQEKEIGDIRRVGYNLTQPEEVVNKIPEFEPDNGKKKKSKDDEFKMELKEYRKKMNNPEQNNDFDYWGNDEESEEN